MNCTCTCAPEVPKIGTAKRKINNANSNDFSEIRGKSETIIGPEFYALTNMRKIRRCQGKGA
jgi:hypothetical protein